MTTETVQANQGAKTSLADQDLVMCVGTNGSYGPITVANLAKLIRESMQIGGRNLLKKSILNITNASYPTCTIPLNDDLTKGESVIVTIWGELGEGKTSFAVFNGNGDGNNGMINTKKVSDGVYRGVLPIKVDNNKIISIYPSPQTVTATSTIKRVKLERGNMPTDWSPAIDDLDILRGGGNLLFTNKLHFRRFKFAGRRVA